MTDRTERASYRGSGRRLVPFPLRLSFSLVHGLVHGSGRVHVRVDPHVDERRLAGLAGALEGRPDVTRLADLLAVAAEHLGELAVRHVAERVADPLTVLAVLGGLSVADLVHRGV